MKFFNNIEKVLKNGFYLDYLFKNFVFYVYKNIINNNFFYIFDKLFTEYIYFYIKNATNYLLFVVNILKKLDFKKLIKLILLLLLQMLIIVLL